ncbi:MAG: tetratricopeptide repeat protein [Betaproteobacteria bacterium]
MRRALALREKSLGPDNPRTAITLNNLARVLLELGRKAEAEKLAAHAAAIHQGKGGRK